MRLDPEETVPDPKEEDIAVAIECEPMYLPGQVEAAMEW